MIQENGELVNSLTNKIGNAKNFANEGEKNLLDAKELSKDADKKRGWLFCCIIMAIIVICAPVILTISQNTGFI